MGKQTKFHIGDWVVPIATCVRHLDLDEEESTFRNYLMKTPRGEPWLCQIVGAKYIYLGAGEITDFEGILDPHTSKTVFVYRLRRGLMNAEALACEEDLELRDAPGYDLPTLKIRTPDEIEEDKARADSRQQERVHLAQFCREVRSHERDYPHYIYP